jgi:hypothetical protein
VKSPKTAQGSKHELANAGPGEPLATETSRGPSGDASIDAPADIRKSRRTVAPDQPSTPNRRTRRHRDHPRSRQASEHAEASARDTTRNRSRNGQDQPRGDLIQTVGDMHRVLTEQIEKLRADPDLDPVRKAHAIAPLAAHVLALLEQFEKLPARPELADERARTIEQLCADVHRVLAEQIESLSADPDADPVKRAGAIARLEREELRLRHLHDRRVAEELRRFDLGAFLTQALEENKSKIEAMKAAAEAADEPNGPARDPASGGM